MKKIIYKIIFIIILFIVVCSYLFNFNKNDDLDNVKLSEVAHSVFYTPMYVAIHNGYFKDNGINVSLITTPGADKVAASVLSGDSDIGFSGSEATIYIYNKNENDYLKSFARLTNKDGSFIVTRKKYKNFKLEDLNGLNIIGGRLNGMPQMTLNYILKKNNINANIDTSVNFDAMASSFIGGLGDAVCLFEPTATEVVSKGFGYKAAAIGAYSGSVPYTSFYAKKSYINDNKDLIGRFVKSIDEGLNHTLNTNSKTLANEIKDEFPSTSLESLTKSIESYKKIEAWPKNSKFTKNDFDRMQDIMILNNAISKKVNFNDLMYDIKN